MSIARLAFVLPLPCIAFLAAAPLADAFVAVEPAEPLPSSPRWSATSHVSTDGRGLDGGLSVAVAPGTAEALLAAVLGTYTADDVLDTRDAIRAAFAAWESPAIAFTIAFDAPALRGELAGAEIDVFAVPGTDPDFAGTPYFGFTKMLWTWESQRLSTNGALLPGYAFRGVDILLNLDNIAAFSPLVPARDDKRRALRRLLMHEIGHALGLNHPNELADFNWDTDSDPLDPIVVNPLDPFAGLFLSAVHDSDAIMARNPATIPAALLYEELRSDDRGGRDVLYPSLPTAVCPPVPRNHCRKAPRSTLRLDMPSDPTKRQLVWKWMKGEATTVADFGDPLASRAYGVCIYDGTPARVLEAVVPADGLRWRPTGSVGFAYKDTSATSAGVKKIKLHAGATGKASATVTAKGAALPAIVVAAVTGPLTVQLANGERPVCFETVYGETDFDTTNGTQLKAKITAITTTTTTTTSTTTTTTLPVKRVFVTSTMHDGNLGGLGGADAICQSRATAAGLPGAFKAWLSSTPTSAASRLTHAVVPYVRVDGVQVAASWADLTDGALAAPIAVTELGATVGDTAYTGTNADGTTGFFFYCSEWTNNLPLDTPAVGIPAQTSGDWSFAGSGGCDVMRRLYCIQQ